ncbi:Hsp70 family protein [Mycobacterium sp.]|uniref:Hsp70 family protein n=1 Tax=Mycobacterium sp. TaxID=1785 RepID=UPI003F9B030C
MVDRVKPALGMSIGATNLAAVTADSAITRRPVLTLYRQRPPEVGVPSENPRLDEPGLVITDFVDAVGHPVGIVAADGSLHRSDALIADALRALAYAATGGAALPQSVAVTYPAHWPDTAVEALGASLSRVSEWSDRAHPLVLIPDAAAALFAARANPGLPAGGTVAVCDFGGSGASITLMDATGDYRALVPTVRHHDFSGNLIDQALLTAVMGNMPSTASFDSASTLASGSLSRLRAECRSAKEQLSSGTVTTLADELPGMHGDFRLTRNELDDVLRESLNRFVAVVEATLARNAIRDLVAVVAVGGGANIPAVTTTLSVRLRVPVVTAPRPQLTPAIGAALRAARGAGATATTMTNRAAPMQRTAPAEALAWPRTSASRVVAAAAQDTEIRPTPEPEEVALPSPVPPKARWYRRVAAIAALVVLLLAGAAGALALNSSGKEATTAPPPTATSTSPAAAPPPASPAPTEEAPAPSTSDTNPPAVTDTPTTAAPPATPQARRPAAKAAPIPRIPAEIPPLPPIPGINEPIPGLDRLNEFLRELESGQIAR